MCSRSLHSNQIVPFEKQYGFGVDLVIIQRGSGSGGEVWLTEIKERNFDISDAEKALRQFDRTLKVLQAQLGSNVQVRRILLHNDLKDCSTKDKAMMRLRGCNVEYLSVARGGVIARRLLNLYRKYY